MMMHNAKIANVLKTPGKGKLKSQLGLEALAKNTKAAKSLNFEKLLGESLKINPKDTNLEKIGLKDINGKKTQKIISEQLESLVKKQGQGKVSSKDSEELSDLLEGIKGKLDLKESDPKASLTSLLKNKKVVKNINKKNNKNEKENFSNIISMKKNKEIKKDPMTLSSEVQKIMKDDFKEKESSFVDKNSSLKNIHNIISGQAFKKSTNSLGTLDKVKDIANISGNTNIDVSEKILSYIKSNYPLQNDSLSVSFNSEDLGQVVLEVSKAESGSNVNVSIQTLSNDANQFFNEQKSNILDVLGKSGVQVSDFNISKSEQSSFDTAENFEQAQDHSDKDHREQKGQDDSQRRKELWNAYKDGKEYVNA